MGECSALADLGASINLMPLSMWKRLSLPELTTTHMTLELANRSITRPKGVAVDVFVKVGKFHFPADFVVVDFDADPRVPFIFGRPFLRMSRALIDVYGEEITLRFNDEAIRLIRAHFEIIKCSLCGNRVNQIDINYVTCDEYLKNPVGLDFWDKIENCLSNGSIPPGNEDFDFEVDLREIELLLNRDPSTDFSPKITIDPNLERFINEPALVCLPPPGDDDDDKRCDLPFCDNNMIFSNPLFSFNDDNYNSSDINHLFNKILEDVKSKDSNISNFDEPVLLNTPLFDEDECFDPGGDIDEIDVFLAIDVPSDIIDAYNDSERDALKIL
ncbi:reverse transcriptase domain-containing protein, partial [Tanacetum coccineum]